MNLTVELEQEVDGRWIAEVIQLPGVLCYGYSPAEAIGNVERLAIDVIADRIAHGEMPSSALAVSFTVPDELLALQQGEACPGCAPSYQLDDQARNRVASSVVPGRMGGLRICVSRSG